MNYPQKNWNTFQKRVLTVTTIFTRSWQVRKAFIFGVFFSFLAILSACEDPKGVGSDVFVEDIGLLYTDTLTVDASTVLLDSIASYSTSNLLVGRLIDPTLGAVQATAYFQISNLTADTIRSNVDTAGRSNVKWITYPSKNDSIRLILPYSFVQGDTLQNQSFKVYQLASTATLDPTTVYYNNSTGPALNPTPIGQLNNVKIRPIRDKRVIQGTTGKFDSLRIPITEPSFVKFLESQRDIAKTEALVGTGFKEIVRGLALVSESNNNAAILGFASGGVQMQLYYHYKYTYTVRNSANTSDSTVTVDTTKSNNFYVAITNADGTSFNARFNKITPTRTGTTISKLTKATDILPASQTNNEAYLQSGTGVAIKVTFPSLLKLKENKDIAINKAQLILEPKGNPAGYTYPSDLILVETTPANRPLRTTTTGDGSFSFVLGEGTTASYASRTNEYSFNVTSSLQNILAGRKKNIGWMIAPTLFATNSTTGARGPVLGKSVLNPDVTRAIFDRNNIKLKVYYTYVTK
ncbi:MULTISPECIES: DUF4270 family protein [unclassified Arcicella]|uniref:DUF4270 family protein n=1 Tax=unclassified Arcicella TaxID=2644986 RepID=UPI002866C3F3|nr:MULTISPECIES: DUF4270 family protein [unclassified Arcicella]MDR6562700.1 hypothetical protein [Arcicella sp. BE51]MDR6812955.1 hypothetical protein [Arcicella sp. BE140]MDR6824269.1 hypothetical protein [Arcicella sp. BE139]